MRNISLKSIENPPQITVSYEGYGRLYGGGKEFVELIGFFKGCFRLFKGHSRDLMMNKTCEIEDLEAISSSRVMFRPKNGRKFEPIYCHPFTFKGQRYDVTVNMKLCIQNAKGNPIKMTIHADERLTTHGKNTITLSENFKPQHEYISDELKTLNEAAKLWANSDPGDKDTHPTNKQVSDWLKARGFSAISAEQGAVIIRPDWATKGRRK